MLIYYTKDENPKVFILNYKVGFSSFKHLVNKNILLNGKNKNQLLKNSSLYIIVRNPIKRFLSFYKDKIIDKIFNKETFKQNCHQQLLKYYSKEYIMNKKFTIDNMIDALENGYNEAHLIPQSNIYKEALLINKNINILKMDDINFNKKICDIIKIDNFLNINKSKSIEIELNELQIIRLKKIYEEDYKNFNY